ncbi:MAG TPA: hypothetical protein VLY84_00120 [Dysgonamonadaceae bacterium]|nr:hypothetical protein [Dysgonamonadaceae bacterium]
MEKITEKLNDLVGKQFSYKGKNITITSTKIVGGTNAVIFIDDRPTNLLIHEVEGFLEELHPPQEKEAKGSEVAVYDKDKMLVFEPTKENVIIKETLLDTLKKLQTDKEFIPQAEAICKVVDQMVAVQKTEIQMLQLINRKS